MTDIKDITPETLHKALMTIYCDMKNCETSGQAIAQVQLPDGRKAEVHVIITTTEEDFLLDQPKNDGV